VEAVLDQVSGSLGGAVDLPGVRVQQDGEALRLLPLAGRKLGQGGNGRNEDN
jgi:hypothetical protein